MNDLTWSPGLVWGLFTVDNDLPSGDSMAHLSSQPGFRSSSRSIALVATILVVVMASEPSQSNLTSAHRHLGWRAQEAETLCIVAGLLATQAVWDLHDGCRERQSFGEKALSTSELCEFLGQQLIAMPLSGDKLTKRQPLRVALLNIPPPLLQIG